MAFSMDAVKASNGENQSLIYLLILSLAMFSLAKMVPGMVESYFSGMGAQNSNFGARIAQAGLASAAGSIAMGANAASAAKSQTQTLNESKTNNNNISTNQPGSTPGGGSLGISPNMNSPITSSKSLTVGSAIKGTAKAAVSVAGAMAAEAFEMNTGGGGTSSEPNVKKFPTEYRPQTQENEIQNEQ